MSSQPTLQGTIRDASNPTTRIFHVRANGAILGAVSFHQRDVCVLLARNEVTVGCWQPGHPGSASTREATIQLDIDDLDDDPELNRATLTVVCDREPVLIVGFALDDLGRLLTGGTITTDVLWGSTPSTPAAADTQATVAAVDALHARLFSYLAGTITS